MTRDFIYKSFLVILLLTLFTGFSQTNKFPESLKFQLTQRQNSNFKEYYEIIISQSVNHVDSKKVFNQRVCLGFQDYNAPNVIVTDGYAIDYAFKSDYSNELAQELKANLIVVEHRFSGKSIPDTMDLENLTMKNAAEDYHFIKELLDTVLTGKWISTGISKGGQAALAYKAFYPNDVVATVVYGTAVKDKQTVSSNSLLLNLSQTPSGKRIDELQLFLFKNKKNLLPYFVEYAKTKKLDFALLDNEAVFDYMLLELPYSFWQNGNKVEEIPDTTFTASTLVDYVIKVVPPRFFSSKNRMNLAPSFYMFYHELGYYEYDTSPFKNWLKLPSYSNNYFAPQGISIEFDNAFQMKEVELLKSKNSNSIFFIYGQNDPWMLQTIAKKNVYLVEGGSHKSRIADLKAEQQKELYQKIMSFVK